MDVDYSKGVEHCIVLTSGDKSTWIKISEAKLLIEKLTRTIERAEKDRDKEMMPPLEDALDDIIREAIKNDYTNEYVGDRMVELHQWANRIKNVVSNETKV